MKTKKVQVDLDNETIEFVGEIAKYLGLTPNDVYNMRIKYVIGNKKLCKQLIESLKKEESK